MTKFFLLTVAFTALTAPAFAAPAPTRFSFDADGKHFDVERVDTAKATILSGVDSEHNYFRLEVVGRTVNGIYGSGPVSYTMPAPIAAPNRLALR